MENLKPEKPLNEYDLIDMRTEVTNSIREVDALITQSNSPEEISQLNIKKDELFIQRGDIALDMKELLMKESMHLNSVPVNYNIGEINQTLPEIDRMLEENPDNEPLLHRRSSLEDARIELKRKSFEIANEQERSLNDRGMAD